MRKLPLALVSFVSLVAVTPAWADGPLERRVYPVRIEASSVRYEDTSAFRTDDHPNYVADDDAKTSWTEGSPGSGVGEKLTFALGDGIEESTRLRLRVRAGCQAAEADFAAHPRPQRATITLRPSGVKRDVTFADQPGWQDVTVVQPSVELGGFELQIASVSPGASSTELCLTDVQVFVTAAADDDAWSEKEKRDRLLAWKKHRLEARKLLAAQGQAVPLLPAYRYDEHEGEELGLVDDDCEDPWGRCEAGALLTGVLHDPHLGAAAGGALELARRAMTGEARLAPVQLTLVDRRTIPRLDGLEEHELRGFPGKRRASDEGLDLPLGQRLGSFAMGGLRAAARKSRLTLDRFLEHASDLDACKTRKGTDFAWSVRDAAADAAGLRAFVVARCGMMPGRSGYFVTHEMQVLVYAPSGRLLLVAGPGYVSAYEWGLDGERAVLTGGRRITRHGTRGVLRATRELARQQQGLALAP
jgi:hypothetical protein